jgi:hypothetical protein
MDRLLKRGQQIGEARADAAADALAARSLPLGIRVERSDTGIMLSGRSLRRRYISDAALRAFIR